MKKKGFSTFGVELEQKKMMVVRTQQERLFGGQWAPLPSRAILSPSAEALELSGEFLWDAGGLALGAAGVGKAAVSVAVNVAKVARVAL